MFIEWLRELNTRQPHIKELTSREALNRAHELRALENKLPPEMVAWAKLNR